VIVYVTKYALTTGVFSLNAEIVDGKYAKGGGHFLAEGDWWYSEYHAENKAKTMAEKKIASLKKQIEKLEAQQKKGPKWKKQ
jgi:hypothetical protein